VGIQSIESMAKKFGLGTVHLPGFPGEKEGIVPGPSWKQKHVGGKWTKSDTILTSIGQGYLLATPLQQTVMMCRLLHGENKAIQPTFSQYHKPLGPSLNIQKAHCDIIKEGLDDVVNHPQGTAFAHRLDFPKFMGGKSGTAQVRRITMAERERGILKNDQLPWKYRDHGSFIGYGPQRDNPQYVVTAFVEHGGGGGSVAAPIVRKILSSLS
jgi:penicillin-binding protein 2